MQPGDHGSIGHESFDHRSQPSELQLSLFRPNKSRRGAINYTHPQTLVRPTAGPFERFHFFPLFLVLYPHMVANGIGMREIARARGYGTYWAISGIVSLQVGARQGQGVQHREA